MFSTPPNDLRDVHTRIQWLERKIRELAQYMVNPVVRPAKLGRGGGGGGLKKLRLNDDDVEGTTKTAPAEEDWVYQFTLPAGGGGEEPINELLPAPTAAGQYLKCTTYVNSSSYTLSWGYVTARSG